MSKREITGLSLVEKIFCLYLFNLFVDLCYITLETIIHYEKSVCHFLLSNCFIIKINNFLYGFNFLEISYAVQHSGNTQSIVEFCFGLVTSIPMKDAEVIMSNL